MILSIEKTARNVAEMIYNEPEDNQAIVDFNKIEFASRSFLHELISDLCDRNVKLVNMSAELEEMMKIVIKNSIVSSKVTSEPGCVYTD